MAKKAPKPEVIIPQPGREVRIVMGDTVLTLKMSASGRALKAAATATKKAAPSKKVAQARKSSSAKKTVPTKAVKSVTSAKKAAKKIASKRPAAKRG